MQNLFLLGDELLKDVRAPKKHFWVSLPNFLAKRVWNYLTHVGEIATKPSMPSLPHLTAKAKHLKVIGFIFISGCLHN